MKLDVKKHISKAKYFVIFDGHMMVTEILEHNSVDITLPPQERHRGRDVS